MRNKHPGLKKGRKKRQKLLENFDKNQETDNKFLNEFIEKTVRGRPSTFTPEVVSKLTTAFSIGCPVTEACHYARISAPTFYKYAPPESDLFNYFMDLKNKPILAARQTVVADVKRPEGARWMLERKLPKEFGPKLLGDESSPIPINISLTNKLKDLLKSNNINLSQNEGNKNA